MLLLEVTYLCGEWDAESGYFVEGENCCRLRVKENQLVDIRYGGKYVVSVKGKRYALSLATQCWVEDAIAAVERLQGREYRPHSIRDIRLAN